MVNRSNQDACLDWAVASGEDGRWWVAPLAAVRDGALALDREAAALLRAASASRRGAVSVVFATGERADLGPIVLRRGQLLLPSLARVSDAERAAGRVEVRLVS